VLLHCWLGDWTVSVPPSAGPRVPEDSVLKQLEDENEGTGWRMAIKIEVVMVASVMDS